MSHQRKYLKYRQRYHQLQIGGARWGAASTQSLQQTDRNNLIRPAYGETPEAAGHLPTHYGTYQELRPNQQSQDVHLHPLYTASNPDGTPRQGRTATDGGLFDGYVLTKLVDQPPVGNLQITEIKIYLRCRGDGGYLPSSRSGISIILKYRQSDAVEPEIQTRTLYHDSTNPIRFDTILGSRSQAVQRVWGTQTLPLRSDWSTAISGRLRTPPDNFSRSQIQAVEHLVGSAWRAVLDFYRDYQETTGRDPMVQCGNSPYYYASGHPIGRRERDGTREGIIGLTGLQARNGSDQDTRARWKAHVYPRQDGNNFYSDTMGREPPLRLRPPEQITRLREQGFKEAEINSRAQALAEYNPTSRHRNPRLIRAVDPNYPITDDSFVQLVQSAPPEQFVQTNGSGGTAIHVAAWSGNYHRVKALLRSPHISQALNTRNHNGFTPLDQAIRRGNPDLITLLVRHGAETNNEELPESLVVPTEIPQPRTAPRSWASDSDSDSDSDST